MGEWPSEKPVEPTPEESRNGWTPETLSRYMAERQKAQSAVIGFDPVARPKAKPRKANGTYNPFKRRG